MEEIMELSYHPKQCRRSVEILRVLNKEHGWSQERLAREVHCSFKTVVRSLQGKTTPQPLTAEAIIKLGEREGLDVEAIMRGEST